MGGKQRLLLGALSLIAFVFAFYANVYGNAFLYDDEFLIVKNGLIQSWDSIATIFTLNSTAGAGGLDSFYRPLQTLLYLIVSQTLGDGPEGFHFLNVFLHALNAVLIFLLGHRLKFSRGASWLAALLWAVNPLHTEAVTYMSATADPLYTMFVLLGLLVMAPTFSWTRVFAASPIFVLGLLSKESAIVMPALAMVTIFLVSEDRKKPRAYGATIPLWVIAFGYLIARKTILDFDNTFNFYKHANVYTENLSYRVETFLATLPSYLSQLVWPHEQHMDRMFPVYTSWFQGPVVLGLMICAVAVAQIVWGRFRRGLILSWGLLWFFAAHVPHMGILLPVNSFFLEHWMYLPSIGLFLGVSATLQRNLRSYAGRRMLVTAAIVLVFAWGVRTFQQNEIWATPITFYENILRYDPNVARIHNNLAMAYSEVGENEKAIEHYRRAIELSDAYPQVHHNLALALVKRNQIQDALAEFQKAIAMDPDFFQSYGALVDLYRQLGDTQKSGEARRRYEEIVARRIPR